MKKSTRLASYIAIFGIVFASGLMVGNSMPTHSLDLSNKNITSSVIGDILSQNSLDKKDLDLRTMYLVKGLLEEKYINIDKIKNDKMSYGVVKGLVDSLDDPYTQFMDPDDTVEFTQALNSELEGIGAELTVRNGLLLVVSTVKGSPAEKANLQPDDYILQIDGKDVEEMTLYEAIKNIRGPKDTSVTLSVLRKDKDDPFDVTIKRAKIIVDSVTSEEVEKGIWHISINEFSDDTKYEFNKILDEIKLKNPKGIILDLRNNGGGYLEGSVDILSGFLRGQQDAVYVKYRDSKEDELLKTTGKPQFPDLPLVVLINKGTASASEIVTLALKDYGRAMVMGTTSYGKGTVQEVDPLPDGSSLRFTIAKWYSPKDTNIDEIGIEPDLVVEPKEEDFDNKFDRQLDEAKKYLMNLAK